MLCTLCKKLANLFGSQQRDHLSLKQCKKINHQELLHWSHCAPQGGQYAQLLLMLPWRITQFFVRPWQKLIKMGEMNMPCKQGAIAIIWVCIGSGFCSQKVPLEPISLLEFQPCSLFVSQNTYLYSTSGIDVSPVLSISSAASFQH